MNIQLKQRLVGAIVLVALAVIFIPMLLPGEGSLSDAIHGSNIPPEPDYRFAPIKPAPKAPPMAEAPAVPLGDEGGDATAESATTADSKGTVAADGASQAAAAKAEKAVTKPAAVAKAKQTAKAQLSVKAKPVPDQAKQTRASAWVVQVGSFSNSTNAKALRDRLRKMGYASFVEVMKAKSGSVYRVRVGPELTRPAAERLQQRIQAQAKLKGLVQSYP